MVAGGKNNFKNKKENNIKSLLILGETILQVIETKLHDFPWGKIVFDSTIVTDSHHIENFFRRKLSAIVSVLYFTYFVQLLILNT